MASAAILTWISRAIVRFYNCCNFKKNVIEQRIIAEGMGPKTTQDLGKSEGLAPGVRGDEEDDKALRSRP